MSVNDRKNTVMTSLKERLRVPRERTIDSSKLKLAESSERTYTKSFTCRNSENLLRMQLEYHRRYNYLHTHLRKPKSPEASCGLIQSLNTPHESMFRRFKKMRAGTTKVDRISNRYFFLNHLPKCGVSAIMQRYMSSLRIVCCETQKDWLLWILDCVGEKSQGLWSRNQIMEWNQCSGAPADMAIQNIFTTPCCSARSTLITCLAACVEVPTTVLLNEFCSKSSYSRPLNAVPDFVANTLLDFLWERT